MRMRRIGSDVFLNLKKIRVTLDGPEPAVVDQTMEGGALEPRPVTTRIAMDGSL